MRIFSPEIFQGHLSKQHYFEGWYFKLVSADERHAIAIIPGVALYDPTDRHAFIQVIDGIAQKSYYYSFPLHEFRYHPHQLEISIGNNYFSKEKISIDLEVLSGEIALQDLNPIKRQWYSPGIMGWYSFVPFMQCYHGIVSLHHQLSGSTNLHGQHVHWNNGVGYIEKDWGISFPKCWIWIHGNHFHQEKRVSLMASVAHIPWLGYYFPGFIVILWIEGIEYRFATYNGSKMKCRIHPDGISISFKRRQLVLDIEARRGKTAELRSPIRGRMEGKINESLQASLSASLKSENNEIWSGVSSTVGLEIAGDTTILESSVWRK